MAHINIAPLANEECNSKSIISAAVTLLLPPLSGAQLLRRNFAACRSSRGPQAQLPVFATGDDRARWAVQPVQAAHNLSWAYWNVSSSIAWQ